MRGRDQSHNVPKKCSLGGLGAKHWAPKLCFMSHTKSRARGTPGQHSQRGTPHPPTHMLRCRVQEPAQGLPTGTTDRSRAEREQDWPVDVSQSAPGRDRLLHSTGHTPPAGQPFPSHGEPCLAGSNFNLPRPTSQMRENRGQKEQCALCPLPDPLSIPCPCECLQEQEPAGGARTTGQHCALPLTRGDSCEVGTGRPHLTDGHKETR